MIGGGGRFLSSILAACVLAGCFTEVGNPDDPVVSVTMAFSIDNRSAPAEDIAISHFYLDVYDAEYWKDGAKLYLKNKEGEDWNDNNGNFVDMTGKDTAARLPILSATSDRWDIFYFSSQVKAAPDLDPDTLDYGAFAGRNFMKGSVARAGGEMDFLYEIPAITRLYLVFRDTTLARLRTSEGYRLDVAFRARHFREGIPWDSIATVRDRNGRRFALLSAASNGRFQTRLKENFRRAFGVDSAQIDGEEPVPGK